MNGLYNMLLFLFVLGSVSQGINSLGVFDITIPEPGISTGSESSVTDLNDGALASGQDFSTVEVLMMFMRVIGAGILAMFTVVPLLVSYMTMMGLDTGIALILAGILQVPIWFVTLMGLFEFWTGRSVT